MRERNSLSLPLFVSQSVKMQFIEADRSFDQLLKKIMSCFVAWSLTQVFCCSRPKVSISGTTNGLLSVSNINNWALGCALTCNSFCLSRLSSASTQVSHLLRELHYSTIHWSRCPILSDHQCSVQSDYYLHGRLVWSNQFAQPKPSSSVQWPAYPMPLPPYISANSTWIFMKL